MGFVVADGKSNWMEGVILICELFPAERSDRLTDHFTASILRYCRRLILVLPRLHLRLVPRCLPHKLDWYFVTPSRPRPSPVVSPCSGIAYAYTISTHCYILSLACSGHCYTYIPTSLYLSSSSHCTPAHHHHTSAVVTWTHTPSAQLRHGHSYIPLRLLRISSPLSLILITIPSAHHAGS